MDAVVFFVSGLDTVNVTQCLKLLRDLAHSGNRTVICTLHTPTASQFLQFDHVYVLTAGRCVYQGSPQQLVPFLTTLTLQCPISHNPADFGKYYHSCFWIKNLLFLLLFFSLGFK